jgi:hypothetical protein
MSLLSVPQTVPARRPGRKPAHEPLNFMPGSKIRSQCRLASGHCIVLSAHERGLLANAPLKPKPENSGSCARTATPPRLYEAQRGAGPEMGVALKTLFVYAFSWPGRGVQPALRQRAGQLRLQLPPHRTAHSWIWHPQSTLPEDQPRKGQFRLRVLSADTELTTCPDAEDHL